MSISPIIVIVGPTASGKTGLGIRLAKEYGGEIVSADSRAIYKHMDIGSAKPTMTERQGVVHWGFDLVEPSEMYTAADYKQYALEKIADIRSRGLVPIVVGGTGLYVDSLLFDYQFPEKAAPEERKKWESMSLEQLHDYCVDNNIALPENKQNKLYVINTILRNGHIPKRNTELADDYIVVGISTDITQLRQQIEARTTGFLESGVINEAKELAHRYGWDGAAMTGNIYPLARKYLDGVIDRAELERLFNIKEWHLAKRQLTWFRHNEHIMWLPLDEAYTYLAHKLDSLNKL
jgi:tRNA dimethylallyltransferase